MSHYFAPSEGPQRVVSGLEALSENLTFPVAAQEPQAARRPSSGGSGFTALAMAVIRSAGLTGLPR